jgi:hypothetical protein
MLGVLVIVFKTTFNNISVISWRSVLLAEETRVPGEIQDKKTCRDSREFFYLIKNKILIFQQNKPITSGLSPRLIVKNKFYSWKL